MRTRLTAQTSGRWIEGLAADMPVTEAADVVLRRRLDSVTTLLSKANKRGEKGFELVHQLRVATRRAGATLEVFQPLIGKALYREVQEQLRQVRRRAGNARDWDIFLNIIKKKYPLAETRSRAVEQVLRLAGKEQTKARRKLTLLRTFGRDLRREARQVIKAVHKSRPSERRNNSSRMSTARSFAALTFSAAGRAALTRPLTQLQEAMAQDLRDMERLHQLRVSVKGLRYTMEIFSSCFSEELKGSVYSDLEAVQEKLGQVNDCHQAVYLLGRLGRRLTRKRKTKEAPAEELSRALAVLVAQQEAERDAGHEEFLMWWKEFQEGDFFERFERMIGSPKREGGTDECKDRSDGAVEGPKMLPTSVRNEAVAHPGAVTTSNVELRRIAAIDVGTNSIRLTVAEIGSDGRYRILDDEKETTRLGRGLASTGKMDAEAMDRSVQAIARMRKIAEGYSVELLRAIGTCAIREAENRDQFLSLVENQAGVVVEPIVAEAEAHLAHVSVAHAFDLRSLAVAVVDIGGGSTEVVLSSQGVIERLYPLPLGTVRLTEQFGGPEQAASKHYDPMRQAIRRVLKRHISKLPFVPQLMMGAGGTFTSLANIAMRRGRAGRAGNSAQPTVRGYELNRSEVRHIAEWLRKMPLRDRVRVPGLSSERADIIVAGLSIVERAMKHLGVNRLQVHDGGIRDGLLRTMASWLLPHDGSPSPGPPDPMRSVQHFAVACNYEERHCNHVAHLAGQIFDQLSGYLRPPPGQWADPVDRILLRAAAVLHDVGYLINYSKHHKHSYHLIAHSDLAGFTPRETELVANIARYHVRAEPRRKHPNFAKLNKVDQKRVRCLAAILRIAEGLDRGHGQNVRSVNLRFQDNIAYFLVDASEDAAVDIWGAAHKSRLFQKVFGLKPRFEQVGSDRDGSPVKGNEAALES
jgi:exopolyphosphatase/guanosine-5'-triphosphate,3'-diphosphate pyrophosphatase